MKTIRRLFGAGAPPHAIAASETLSIAPLRLLHAALALQRVAVPAVEAGVAGNELQRLGKGSLSLSGVPQSQVGFAETKPVVRIGTTQANDAPRTIRPTPE